MSMTLKKVELWNIKTHEYFLFEPDLTGITSVSGVNGAGKSTLVDSFAWALYGTKANNIKNKELIREGISLKGKENKDVKCQVEVEITVNNIDYLVRRAIVSDGGATECNVYGRVDSSTEYNHLAGPAVSSAEAYIKQILKMDEKGFLTAILIQQKQVDQIIDSSPRERGEVIEKLTGIQSITNGMNLAREEAKEYQQSANAITVEDTDTLREQIEEAIEKGKSLAAIVKQEKEELVEYEEKYKESYLSFKEEEERTNSSIELKNKIALLENDKKNLSEELSRVTKTLTDYQSSNSTTIAIDTTEIEENLTKVEKTLADKRTALVQLKNEEKRLQAILDENKDYTVYTKTETNKSLKAAEKEVERLSNEETALVEKVHEIQALIKQSKKSLETVNSGDTTCPVCKAHIEDPEELKAEIKGEIESLNEKLKEVKAAGTKNNSELRDAKQDKADQEVILETLDLIKTSKKDLKDVKSQIKASKDEYDEIEVEHKVLNTEYKEALKVSAQADEINRAKVRLKELTLRLATIDDEISSIQEELNTLHAKTQREIAGMRNALEKQKNAGSKLLIEVNKKEEELKYMRLQVASQKEQYARAIKDKERHENLVAKMKEANVTGAVLSKFKEERIKYSIPTLEMYASIVLSKFTEGKFTKIALDSKFNTTVYTEEGNVRPISKLSGGELSAVAIALRVGISMLLNDGDNNILILDEILVSMDKVRARHIIETISSMINCQIIFIAHNPEIQNVADKNVEIGAKVDEE